MTIRLDYFYGTDIGQFKFIRAPKLLFEVACYLRVSFEARMFFACLLDRVCLSMRNGLVDSKGRVYIFFTLKSAMKLTGYGHNKVERMYKELENAGLIERKAQGLGKPVRIYVKDFKEAEGMETEAAFEMEQMVMDGYAPETETPDCADESPESVRGDFPEKAAPVSAQTEAAPERTDAQTRIPASPTAAQPRPEMPRPSARAATPAEPVSAFMERFCPAFASALVSAVKSVVAGCGNVENFSTNVENSASAPRAGEPESPLTSGVGEAGQPHSGSPDFRKRAANYTDSPNDTFSNDTYPIYRGVSGKEKAAKKMEKMKVTKEVIEENIDYPTLIREHPHDAQQIDEYVSLMTQTCCSDKPTVRINSEDYPRDVVRACFKKLNGGHILYVLECMKKNATKIRNIRAYTLSALFNSYSTIDSYYGAEVSHDFAKRDRDDDGYERRHYGRGRSRASYAYA